MNRVLIDLHICRYDEVGDDQKASYKNSLSDPELDQLSRFEGQRADHFIIEKGYTRDVLSRSVGLPAKSLKFERTEKGKPALVSSSQISSNLSHCKDLFVVAVSKDAAVGVDVERTQRSNNLERIALHYFAEEEIDFLMVDPNQLDIKFTHLWTVKESIGKLIGIGINKTFLQNATKIEQGKPIPNRSWLKIKVSVQSYVQSNHLLSVAVECASSAQVLIHENDWKRIN